MGVAKVILNGDTLIDVTQKTVTSNNLLSGITALGADGEGVTGTYVAQSFSTQSKTVTPTESSQSIFPDSGYDGLSQVIVNGISSNYVGTNVPRRSGVDITQSDWTYSSNTTYDYIKANISWSAGYYSSDGGKTFTSILTRITDLPTQGSITIAPTEASQLAVQSRRWLTGDVTVDAISSTYIGTGIPQRTDANVKANGWTFTSNTTYDYINVPIYWSSGYYPPNGNKTFMSNIVDIASLPKQASLTITPTESAQTAVQKRRWLTGDITVAGISSTYVGTGIMHKAATTYTPTITNQTIASEQYLDGVQTILGDANLVPENIADGVSIFGVSGTHQGGGTGYTIDDIASLDGISGAISGTVTSIRSGAFNNTQITQADFSQATYIGSNAFTYCLSLSSVSFPMVTQIESGAFSRCSNSRFKSVYFPECTSIGISAFAGCKSFTSVSFPKLLTIGNYAFNGCTSLVSINAPSVTTIYGQAFLNCYSLSSVSFPLATLIGADAFGSCSKLQYADFPLASSINTNAFNSCGSLSYANFETATQIGEYAFKNCTKLTSTSFPNVTGIFSSAFYYCISLPYINLPSAIRLAEYAFGYCSRLSSIDLPLCTTIERFAFISCTSLSYINLPAITNVSSYAFASCTGLQSADLSSATDFGSGAFASCSRLTTVNAPSLKNVGDFAFANCTSLTTLNAPLLSNLSYRAFYYCRNLSSITTTNIRYLNYEAFYMCTALESFTANSLSVIPSCAFQNCSALSTVSLYMASIIGSSAFQGCASLSSVYIPNAIIISSNAFTNCPGLKLINLGNASVVTRLTGGYARTFSGTTSSAEFSIYVSSTMYSLFISSGSPWSTASSRIVSSLL